MRFYLLTGGTGLIGQAITQQLLDNGDRVIIHSRDRQKVTRLFDEQVTAIESFDEIPDSQQLDAVINLAGAPIADRRWTQSRKKILLDSRVETTRQLVNWLNQRLQKPAVLVSGSAVGWYGDGGKTPLTEGSGCHDEFSHRLCDQWEDAARQIDDNVRLVIIRTGLVLAPDGGFLKRMQLPFKLGLGGRIGNGEQYMPWIHLDDISGLFIRAAVDAGFEGVYNGTAPAPVSNQVFTQTLAQVLHRPAVLPLPACVLKAGLGEMSRLLLTGQRALPDKARRDGFQFRYPELYRALENVTR